MKKINSRLLVLAIVGSTVLFQFCQKADIPENGSELTKSQETLQWKSNTLEGNTYEMSYPANKVGPLQVVNNGGFETGFSGWDVSATGYGINGDLSQAWIVGSADPNATNFVIYYGSMPHSEPLAHSGDAGASAVQNGSTYHRLSQDVTLPAGVVELSYWIRWKSQAAWTALSGGQNIQVNLKDVGTDALLATLFDASSMGVPLFSGGGDFNTANYEYHSYDISAYAGQTVKLEFKIDVQNYFMYVDLDDVEIIQVSYPAELQVKDPGDEKINLESKGNIPVTLLSDADFDATEMDLSTITLGNDDGNDTPIIMKNNGTYQASYDDVNGDGLKDLVMHFDTQGMVSNGDLDENTIVLKFNGSTVNGQHVIGSDEVIVM